MTDDPFAAVDRETFAAQLEAQRHLIALELGYYERMLETDVGAERLLLGAGVASGQLLGAPQDRYNGIAVFNPTATVVWWSPSPSAVAGATPYQVPPFSWVCLPTRYADCSVAIADADAAGPQIAVSVLRLRVPPAGVRAGAWGGGPIADTLATAASVSAPAAGTTIVSTPVLTGVHDVAISVWTPDNASYPMQVRNGGAVAGTLLSTGYSTPAPQRMCRLTLVGAAVSIVTAAAIASSASAEVLVTRVA